MPIDSLHELVKESESTMEKDAQSYWANPEAIEEQTGVPLGPREENAARDQIKRMIQEPGARGFVMRHPYLTGIPTAGIANALAGGSIRDQAIKNLQRENPDFREEYREERKTRAQETQAGRAPGGQSDTQSKANKAKNYAEVANALLDVGSKAKDVYDKSKKDKKDRS